MACLLPPMTHQFAAVAEAADGWISDWVGIEWCPLLAPRKDFPTWMTFKAEHVQKTWSNGKHLQSWMKWVSQMGHKKPMLIFKTSSKTLYQGSDGFKERGNLGNSTFASRRHYMRCISTQQEDKDHGVIQQMMLIFFSQAEQNGLGTICLENERTWENEKLRCDEIFSTQTEHTKPQVLTVKRKSGDFSTQDDRDTVSVKEGNGWWLSAEQTSEQVKMKLLK